MQLRLTDRAGELSRAAPTEAWQDSQVRPTHAEIDLSAIRENVSSIVSTVQPAEVCTVVKADGYGHGDVPVAEVALDAGARMLAVALVEEGIRLREAGIEAPVLVLSEPDVGDAAELVHWGLTPTAYRPEFIHALASASQDRVEVHLKIDTGMHRVGAVTGLLADLVAMVEAAPSLALGAVWTHFAVADEDSRFTDRQVRSFRRAVGDLDVSVHLANTAGALLFPSARGDMVRVGLGTYGLHPCDATRPVVALRPAMRVASAVSHLQRLPADARPSYGRRRPLEDEATVATVPIGYADGLPRLLSSTGGEVLIGGSRHPLAGTITMDQIVVDVGDHPVDVGDEVVLIGSQGGEEISADEWAAKVGTISYEIVCDIGPRVPRRYRG
ncbi:alanine racemase [soil metagenome]